MIPLLLLIIGYALNVFLAGGMLTYLYVREDDYWDDEDLGRLGQTRQGTRRKPKLKLQKLKTLTSSRRC